VREAALTRAT